MSLFDVPILIVELMLTAAFLLALLRMVRGPTMPDRVVALNLITTIAAGNIALVIIVSNEKVILDVAIVLALVSFPATVALAYYVKFIKGAPQ